MTERNKNGCYLEVREVLKRHFGTSEDLFYVTKYLLAMIFALLEEEEKERKEKDGKQSRKKLL